MATITLSSVAPEEGKVHFTFGAEAFDLGAGDKYETEDPAVIADAAQNHWLKIEYPEVTEPAASSEAVVSASNDPHVNPAVDHLNSAASPEVVEAAQRNADAIRAVAQGNTNVGVAEAVEGPTAPETVADQPPAAVVPEQSVAEQAPAEQQALQVEPSTQEHTV